MRIIICSIFFSICIFGQIKNFQPDRKSLKSMNLKGNVTKVETITTYSTSKSNWTDVFNDDGYLIYGIKDNDTIHRYYYDFQFNLKKYITTSLKEKLTITYTIDENNNVKSSGTSDYRSYFFWEGNKLGNDEEYWIFDDKGNVIAENTGYMYIEYLYNEKYLVIEEKQFDYDNGKWTGTFTNEYNKYNDIVKRKYKSAEEYGSDYYEFKYEYDKKGNWIKKTSNNNEVEVRKITYGNNVPAAKSGKKKINLIS